MKRLFLITILMASSLAIFARTDQPAPAAVTRDTLINDHWRFFLDEQKGASEIPGWRYLVDSKPDLPKESDPGWQDYQSTLSPFREKGGTIWIRAILPPSKSKYPLIRVTGVPLDKADADKADEARAIGAHTPLPTIRTYLNGTCIRTIEGTTFDLGTDRLPSWKAGEPNEVVFQITQEGPSPVHPLGHVYLVENGAPQQVQDDAPESRTDFDDSRWTEVLLPHFGRLEPADAYRPFQGVSWYRTTIVPTPEMKGRRITVEFEGAMQISDVWVNGEHRQTHLGGYLPFTLDLTGDVEKGKPITLAVRVDNRPDPLVPPGKPLEGLDFEYYGGIYRNVWLHNTDSIHLSDPIAANRADAGILVTYPSVTEGEAVVEVRADVVNDGKSSRPVKVRMDLFGKKNVPIASATSEPVEVAAGGNRGFVSKLKVARPSLWSPDSPSLYQLKVTVLGKEGPLDQQHLKIGIRSLALSGEKLLLNGKPILLSGANRHHCYPWIGNALSDAAQRRDLKRLKDAGWNFVRLAHYPQSPGVMQACDELGLLAIVCEPGWQHWTTEPFFARMQQAIREMVRWHRNHPSAGFWEVAVNEAYAPREKVNEWSDAVHQELPGALTCGDTREYARADLPKDAKPRDIRTAKPKGVTWDIYYPSWSLNSKEPVPADVAGKCYIEREYGDVLACRNKIGDGEAVLVKSAIAHLDSQAMHQKKSAPGVIGLARWSFNDQTRGANSQPAYWGVVDQERNKKFIYEACRSQGDPSMRRGDIGGPMVFIANYWTPESPKDVTVFSNCSEVELFLNGKTLGRKSPESTPEVAHPPFVFKNLSFEPGELKAVGYLNGKKVAEAIRNTPEKSAKSLKIVIDDNGVPFRAKADSVFVRVMAVDAKGTVIPSFKGSAELTLKGDGQIASESIRPFEGGVASFLIRSGDTGGTMTLRACSNGILSEPCTLKSGGESK